MNDTILAIVHTPELMAFDLPHSEVADRSH